MSPLSYNFDTRFAAAKTKDSLADCVSANPPNSNFDFIPTQLSPCFIAANVKLQRHFAATAALLVAVAFLFFSRGVVGGGGGREREQRQLSFEL